MCVCVSIYLPHLRYAKLLRIRAAQQQQTAVQEIESERGGNIEVQKVEVEEPPQLDDDQIVSRV